MSVDDHFMPGPGDPFCARCGRLLTSAESGICAKGCPPEDDGEEFDPFDSWGGHHYKALIDLQNAAQDVVDIFIREAHKEADRAASFFSRCLKNKFTIKVRFRK